MLTILELLFSAAIILFVLPNFVVISDSYSNSETKTDKEPNQKIEHIHISSLTTTPSDAMMRHNLQLFNRSLSDTGFAIIHLDHDPSLFSPSSLGQLKAAATSFFEASESHKMSYNFGPYGNSKGGYTPVGVEDVGSTSGSKTETGKDWVENYVFRSHPEDDSTNHPKELMEAGRAYFDQMEAVLKVLHKMAAMSFDLEEVGVWGGWGGRIDG